LAIFVRARVATERSEPATSAPVRFAPVRFALVKSTLVRFARLLRADQPHEFPIEPRFLP
jgi:hypothetical protein